MRHRRAGRKLSRDRSHRKALFKNLINALVVRGEIKTTEAKAKSVRRLVDKLITKGKKGTLHSRRLIASFLQDKKAVNKIVDELGPLFKKRPGGFTRIIRLGRRRGDDAMMVKLELVEKPQTRAASGGTVRGKPQIKPTKVKSNAKNKNNKKKRN